jgi:hypothetical protein
MRFSSVKCIAMLFGVKLQTYKASKYLELLSEYREDKTIVYDELDDDETTKARKELTNLIEKNFDGVMLRWYWGCDEENNCSAYLVLDEIPCTEISKDDAPYLDFDKCADLHKKYVGRIKKILKIFGEENSKICIHVYVYKCNKYTCIHTREFNSWC